MATNYVQLNKFNSNGALCLSSNVFRSLGLLALDNVKEVIKRTDKKGIKLNDEVNVTIKDDVVKYYFDVEIDKGISEARVKESIIDIVTTNLILVLDSVPFEIKTKIRKK